MTTLAEYLRNPMNPHRQQGNPRVKVNALWKTSRLLKMSICDEAGV